MKIIYAEVITIGDEILYGQITDTNSKWISEELDKIGIKTIRKSSVGDQKQQILNILDESLQRADIVLITGGLGPTKDDITKKTLAEYFNDELVINPHAEEFIRGFFEKRGRPFTELNRQQAAIPSQCTYLHNATGTAPGMLFEHNGKVIVSMPGVPLEMKYLISNEVIPRIKSKFELPEIVHKIIRTIGLGESFLAERIENWEDSLPEHIKLAYLPSFGEVKLRLTGMGENRSKVEEQIQLEVNKLIPLIEEHIFSFENEEIEKSVGKILNESGTSLSVAESCTGGYLSHLLTSIPGSSAYFMGGVVSYSNEAKMDVLKVKQETLTKFGAVSEQTVIEMAEGVRNVMKTTYGIATSGIAGPDGGTDEKPVGTVWLAVTDGKQTLTKKLSLGKIRIVNIEYSAKAALNFLRILTKGK
ncbi:competence/damage-inducible protein A [Lacihabitans sp. CS3-21]|uniref:competence/damage-inducible protein A n=1 Tax=Lacihabitans sp. CS3-21 TaxID=2487332 RepID=UPI0020CF9511|nr:competence/damage-inducible protein A [Lacihabitans sp. CS3-21]MCP9746861.1 competence/damage-inducible protein A [Lacihabitans sp. CS3-21]